MGHPDGAHTHGSGGSGLGPVVLVILAVALLGPAVTAAAVALLHLLVIAAPVIGGLALARRGRRCGRPCPPLAR
jgi:hypothetical protein